MTTECNTEQLLAQCPLTAHHHHMLCKQLSFATWPFILQGVLHTNMSCTVTLSIRTNKQSHKLESHTSLL